MNAIATMPDIQLAPVALALGDDLAFTDWIEIGRTIVAQRRNVEWMLGDWYRHGSEHYRKEEQFQLFAQQLGEDPRRLAKLAQVAAAFPEAKRSQRLSFDIHSYLACFPESERLERLAQAEREGWTASKAREVAVQHRQSESMFEDEDTEYRFGIEIIRAWNRAPREARQFFAELVDTESCDPIDPEQVHA